MYHQNSRRKFVRNLGYGLTSVGLLGLLGCRGQGKKKSEVQEESKASMELFFKISLAQWSLHRAFEAKELDSKDFAAIAKTQFEIDAVEYVNSFYKENAGNSTFWQEMNSRAQDNGVKNLLIMVDDEGNLGDTNDLNRDQAVKNHYKWVDAASQLECHSIRINAFGEGTREEVGSAVIEGLGSLAEYAETAGINVVIENHGNYSSNGKWVTNIISQVNKKNCGTLPDFGNFCTGKKWGSTKNNDCQEVYDRYLGVSEMMPYAVGVSAKSYEFNEAGDETIIDYFRMLQIVKDAGFTGYIGIEYEGDQLSEPEGINATKRLLEKAGSKVK